MKVNRYAGEIRINPVPILRGDEFNNDGAINDIDALLEEAISIQNAIQDRLTRLRQYLRSNRNENFSFHFADGGYIAVSGISDQELHRMNSLELIDLFDFAADRDWVRKYGAQFGLAWENGRAVPL